MKATTDSSRFVPPEERIATFDQDGTLWMSHPIYSFVMYALDRVPAVVKAKLQLTKIEPFKPVLTSRHSYPGTLRRGQEGRLGRHQHEERISNGGSSQVNAKGPV